MDPAEIAIEDVRRLRQMGRDLVSLSTLSAICGGLGPDGMARGLADYLFDTLSLDLIYVRLPGVGRGLIEVVRTRHGSDRSEEEAVKASRALVQPVLTGKAHQTAM